MTLKIDDNIGWIDVEIGDKTHRIDLYAANDAFAEAMIGVNEETPSAVLFDRLRNAAEAVKLPPLSIRALLEFQAGIFARMAELKKAVPVAASAD